MLPTFVIGLREGLEAALIVGIVAAFLRQRGRLDLLKLVWFGVGIAVALCVAVGITLKIVSAELPQRQQEGLETIVGLIAVAMVTYMVVWMRRHSRGLKKQLEGAADTALAAGGAALVATAFLAVLREGFETAVFLLAAFNETRTPLAAGAGAVLGVAVAVGLGYGIYRGGVRINLSKFFRATGLVLVLVAAGLLVSAAHTAHEAGWLNFGQGRTFDLGWLVQPGSVQSSLLTGMLGWQPRPVTIEVVVWLLYLIPVGLYVAWPPGRPVPLRAVTIGSAVVAVGAGAAAIVLVTLAPSPVATPATQRFATSNGAATVEVTDRAVTQLTFRTDIGGTDQQITGQGESLARRSGRAAEVVHSSSVSPTPDGLPADMTLAQVAQANGDHLPLGVNADTEPVRIPMSYTTESTTTIWVDVRTGLVLDAERTQQTLATAQFSSGAAELSDPIRTSSVVVSTPSQRTSAELARHIEHDNDRHNLLRRAAGLAALVAAIATAMAALFGVLLVRRRTEHAEPTLETPPASAAAPVGARADG